MEAPQENILILVPCFNEELRLNFTPFKRARPNQFFLFVNDGSTDGTAGLIQQHVAGNIMLLDLKQNQGKAEAVRQGMIYAQTLPVFRDVKWVGFWDADLATPIEEIDNFLKYRQTFYPDAEAIFGSRILRLGSTIHRQVKRHYLGRVFATAVSIMTDIKSYDSQCGAKIFLKEIVPIISSEPFISRWAFDVEIILRLKDHIMVEYPLRHWEDVKGSKLNIMKTAFKIISDLYHIRKKYRR
jgi:glycosyltransferase involved in cell wall biosynthesis